MTIPVYVEDYYVSSWTQAFQDALAASNHVKVGPGQFVVTSPIQIADSGGDPLHNKRIEGSGYERTQLVQTTTGQPVINIPQGVVNLMLDGFTAGHGNPSNSIDPVTGYKALGPKGYATSGGDGIRANVSVDQVTIRDVRCNYNYEGFNLGRVSFGVIENSAADSNTDHGFIMQSSATGPMQWYLRGCSSSRNGQDGFTWYVTGNGAGVSVGQMNDCVTYLNGRHGVSFLGSATQKLFSARLEGGFFGEDGGHGIYVDTYASLHNISPSYVEITNDCGIYISINNRDTTIRASVITNCGLDGIFNYGEGTVIDGGVLQANGRRHQSGRRNGIYCYEEPGSPRSCLVSNVRSTDTVGPAGGGSLAGNQLYGVVCGPNAQLVGNDLTGNSTAGIIGTPHASSGLNRT